MVEPYPMTHTDHEDSVRSDTETTVPPEQLVSGAPIALCGVEVLIPDESYKQIIKTILSNDE